MAPAGVIFFTYKLFYVMPAGVIFFTYKLFYVIIQIAVAESGGLQTSEKEVSKYRRYNTDNRSNLYAISHY